MTPLGYMLKKIHQTPLWANVEDVYSVSHCISEAFTNYIDYWRHNDYGCFDTPDPLFEIAKEKEIDLHGLQLFYYEVYELEYNEEEKEWLPFLDVNYDFSKIVVPKDAQIEEYDIVTFSLRCFAECSPLSCNGIFNDVPVNKHCLIDKFESAVNALNIGIFDNCEPGSMRIFAVYRVPMS
jgi:hypothetical protein